MHSPWLHTDIYKDLMKLVKKLEAGTYNIELFSNTNFFCRFKSLSSSSNEEILIEDLLTTAILDVTEGAWGREGESSYEMLLSNVILIRDFLKSKRKEGK